MIFRNPNIAFFCCFKCVRVQKGCKKGAKGCKRCISGCRKKSLKAFCRNKGFSNFMLLKFSATWNRSEQGYRGTAVARTYDMQFTKCHKHYGVT